VALVPMPGKKLKFDQDWLEWCFLMKDEAAPKGDVFVYVTARTVEHNRNSKLLGAGREDEKAIEDRLADIQKTASRKFDRGEFASSTGFKYLEKLEAKKSQEEAKRRANEPSPRQTHRDRTYSYPCPD
jgi:hypothetical protein